MADILAIHVTRDTWPEIQRDIDWLEPIVVLSEESRILTGNDGALYRVPRELWYGIVVPSAMLLACDIKPFIKGPASV
jgi:hypothetical protein